MTTWADNAYECIRCGDAPAVDELGYCGHCHWAVKAEVEDGYFRLRQYLTKWARFDDWCSTRDRADNREAPHGDRASRSVVGEALRSS